MLGSHLLPKRQTRATACQHLQRASVTKWTFSSLWSPLRYQQHSLALMEAYDPSRNMWLKLADMVSPCSGLGACSLFGLLYTVGRTAQNVIHTVELPHLSLSQKKNPKPISRKWHN